MQLNDFIYNLPSHLIAQYPLEKRGLSRLLCLDKRGKVSHSHFPALFNLVSEGDLLVFNNTKVIPARLFGRKQSGGQVEVLVERILSTQRVLAQLRVSKPPKIGDELIFPDQIRLTVLNRGPRFYELMYSGAAGSIVEIIDRIGQIPLPPYINRLPDARDKERYQTVYAKHKGSVAAPTAGFHFDDEFLQRLKAKVDFGFLTLHVGAGTFTPVRVENIKEHAMHPEYLVVSPRLCDQIKKTKKNGGRVIAIGTTSLRALETASQQGEIAPYAGETSIFIYPGYPFRCIDALVTNLHLPCSTLLMLVCAFGGHQAVINAYQEAVDKGYRFYSYGDAMWIG